jgi:hypothetical protein
MMTARGLSPMHTTILRSVNWYTPERCCKVFFAAAGMIDNNGWQYVSA